LNRPFLVFDLDGTLIDGYEAIADALAFAMGRLGEAPLPLPRVRRMVGHGLESLLEEAVGKDRAFGSNMNGFLDAVVGGWSLDGVARVQTGEVLDFAATSLTSLAVMSERRSSCFAERGSRNPSPETPMLNEGQTKPNSRLRANSVVVFSRRLAAAVSMTTAYR